MDAIRTIVDDSGEQLVLDIPPQLRHRRVEVIVLPLDTADAATHRPVRRPHPDIAGQGRTLGDIVSPIADETEWDCLQ